MKYALVLLTVLCLFCSQPAEAGVLHKMKAVALFLPRAVFYGVDGCLGGVLMALGETAWDFADN